MQFQFNLKKISSLFTSLGLSFFLMNCSNENNPVTMGVEQTNLTTAAVPSPWFNKDIGTTGKVGNSSATTSSGLTTATINGAGDDIWGTADAFHYMYQPVTGDVQLIAKIESVQNTNLWAKAGVMIRASLNSDAINMMIALTPSTTNGITSQKRTTIGGTSTKVVGGNINAPYWLKIERMGYFLSVFKSSNGTTWESVEGASMDIAATVYVGLAVTSHTTAALCAAKFSNVSIKKLYYMSFDSQGGTYRGNQVVVAGAFAKTPIAPTRTGYTFGGWYKEPGCINVWNFSTTPVNADVTIYAKWIIRDASGNVYTEVKIGNQVWMVENFRSTKYNDGTSLVNMQDAYGWSRTSTPAYCYYNNNSAINNVGVLYNWYVVNTNKLAPAGWHVPTTAEWETLQTFVASKAAAVAHKVDWYTSTVPNAIGYNLSTNNNSGMSIRGAGRRNEAGIYSQLFEMSWFWTSIGNVTETANFVSFSYDSFVFTYRNYSRKAGFSVRLIRDN